MKLKTKAWIVSVVVIAALFGVMLVGLLTAKKAANDDNRARIEQLMRSSYQSITQFEKMAAEGKMGEAEARAAAMAVARENKYHASEYCFVVDEKLTFIAAPLDPQLHGTSFNEFKDSHGQSVGELAKAALRASGGKLTEYWWSSTNGDKTAQILSVAIETPRWKWIVGNGVSFAEAERRFWESARWQVLICLALGGMIAGLTLFSVRHLVRTLGGEPQEVLVHLQRIADGDLRDSPENRLAHAHPKSVLGAVDKTRDALRTVLLAVSEASQSIHQASGEIANGTRDLSGRTEQAACSLEETSAAMKVLAESVHENDLKSQKARDLANTSAAVAHRGGSLMEEVVHTMQGINDSASEIGEIIGVINGITFQTNILALNAAVEAARAGEQGRGFAVVASEVRSLAQRSAQAAREIKSLIEVSSGRVAAGRGEVESAGLTMREIVQSGHQVKEVVLEIGTSTKKQSQNISEVSHAISILDDMTQQNAALTEQAMAATESLDGQARQLSELVSTFKL